MIGDIARSLDALRPEQYFCAFLFLCSYACALGQLFDLRGRMACAGLALLSAAGFVVRGESWETGIILIALSLVAMGAFTASAWLGWRLLHRGDARAGAWADTVLLA